MTQIRMVDYSGHYKNSHVPGEFLVQGVKHHSVDDRGVERFETCAHNDEKAVGWTISYNGWVWCPIIFRTEGDVKAALELMVAMFHQGERHNQWKVKKVLGIE